MQQHDILLGRDEDGTSICLPGGAPVAVHAPTETGKTADFVIGNAFAWPGSLVVLDIKGEVFDATAGYRASIGQKVYKFEPASEDGRSHRWNPFESVDRGAISRFRSVYRAASIVFPEVESSGSGNHKFWDDSGRQAFAAVATLLAESDGDLTMDLVSHLFHRADGHKWLAQQVADRRSAGRPYSAKAVDGISNYTGGDPKLRNDIRQTVSTKLQLWMSDPQVSAATEVSDFNLEDLRRKPMTIYVVVAPGDMEWLRPLLRLFFNQMIAVNTRKTPKKDPSLKYQTLIMLDEFARLGRVDALAYAAQYVRGYGLRMAYIMQDAQQLEAIYTLPVVRDIFANVGAEVVFGVTDPELALALERRMGDNTVSYTTFNKQRFLSWMNPSRQQAHDAPHARPLMLDQEILKLPPDRQIILRRGADPALTWRLRWFENEEFKTRYKPPPEIPMLDIKVRDDDGTTDVLPPPPPGELKHGR